MPYLQTPLLFPDNDLTVISSRAELFKTLINSDYNESKYNIVDMDLSTGLVKTEEKFDIVILPLSLYARKSLPNLLSNAYNYLKPRGIMAIRDKYYTYINSTSHVNWCMSAGMPKKKLMEDFFAKFKKVVKLEEDETEIEPEKLFIENNPLKLKNEDCWVYDGNDYYHPNHEGNWFLFIGVK